MYPNFGSSIFGGAPGVATIETGSSVSYFSVLFHNYVGVFYGKYLSGTWTWQQLALQSDVDTRAKHVAAGQGANGQSVTVEGSTVGIIIAIKSLSGQTAGLYAYASNASTIYSLTEIKAASGGVTLTYSGLTVTLKGDSYVFIKAIC